MICEYEFNVKEILVRSLLVKAALTMTSV